jgi:hypothetical protein
VLLPRDLLEAARSPFAVEHRVLRPSRRRVLGLANGVVQLVPPPWAPFMKRRSARRPGFEKRSLRRDSGAVATIRPFVLLLNATGVPAPCTKGQVSFALTGGYASGMRARSTDRAWRGKRGQASVPKDGLPISTIRGRMARSGDGGHTYLGSSV